MSEHYIYYQRENGDLDDIAPFCSAICREDYMRGLSPSRNCELKDETDPDKSGWSAVTLSVAHETDNCEYCANNDCGDIIRHGLLCEHEISGE